MPARTASSITAVRSAWLELGPPRQVAAAGIGSRVAPAPRRDHVLIRRDSLADLVRDWLELGQHRDPSLSSALGDVGADPDPACALEMAPLQPAQLSVASARANADVGDAALAHRLCRCEERRGLGTGQPVDLRRSGLRPAGLARRVIPAISLLHRPVVERHEDRAVLALRVRMRPAPQRALDILAPDIRRVAVVEVIAMVVERAAVRALTARTVDAALGAHVRDVEIDRARELHGPTMTALTQCE